MMKYCYKYQIVGEFSYNFELAELVTNYLNFVEENIGTILISITNDITKFQLVILPIQ
jgi:hypothetical protein